MVWKELLHRKGWISWICFNLDLESYNKLAGVIWKEFQQTRVHNSSPWIFRTNFKLAVLI